MYRKERLERVCTNNGAQYFDHSHLACFTIHIYAQNTRLDYIVRENTLTLTKLCQF